MAILQKLISGGQTGVDRGALDAAIAAGVPHGGWCPAGRRAEDGTIAPTYQLFETPGREYRERTERNVLDSDATLILTRGPLKGGTALTARLARRHRKPVLVVRLDEQADPAAVLRWLNDHQVGTLNVAGPRESENPVIAQQAHEFIAALLATAQRTQ